MIRKIAPIDSIIDLYTLAILLSWKVDQGWQDYFAQYVLVCYYLVLTTQTIENQQAVFNVCRLIVNWKVQRIGFDMNAGY